MQIATVAYEGHGIKVVFNDFASALSGVSGSFLMDLGFDEENIGSDEPVNIVFNVQGEFAQKTVSVDFDQTEMLEALALTPMAADIDINGHVGQITIDTAGTYRVYDSAPSTETGVWIACMVEGVILTLDGVDIDVSGSPNTCALEFTGAGNALTLTGNK